jgi:chemotaxis protein CheC
LLLDEKAALLLNELLTDQVSPAHAIDSGVREVLTEVGNILLNACLGVFGNLLEVQVSFSVPRMSVDSVERVLNSICVKEEELRYGIMIHTRFRMRDNNVVGYMVIILGITSLDRLLVEMKRWEEREVA